MSSQPREVGEPIVNVETVVTVLPDGRKVTKTIKKITHSYQVEVPAGTPIPEGATLVSTADAGIPQNGTTTTYHSSSYSSSDKNGAQPELHQEFNNKLNFEQGATAIQNEPTIVVQSTIDDDGRKVTKTTTTTSSSSSSSGSSPFSKFFKRLSRRSSKSDKPLPSIPVSETKTEVKEVIKSGTDTVKEVLVQSMKVKHSNGSAQSLSKCTGERRALLIGINYTGRPNPLQGCINDTAVMKDFLLGFNFKEENIRVLTDDQVDTPWMPTRENIIENLKWLLHGAQKDDSLFLHYSGHGGQVLDLDDDEVGDYDNCIFPLDHKENGVIIDDELHMILVKALPPGVRLTVLFDCCHSGSALDLPYIYTGTGYIRGSDALANLGHELVSGNFDPEALKNLQAKWVKLKEEKEKFELQVKLKAVHDADVVMFSGCKDDETSADVSVTRGKTSSANGAMTYAFTKSYRENSVQTYQDFLNSIRDLMREKYKQKPQLSSSRPKNMAELFFL